MRLFGIISVLLYFSISGFSQPTIEWQKSLGGSGDDRAVDMHQTSDGGYILCGYSSSNDGDVSNNHGGFFDCWIVKLSSVGIIEWEKTFGGSGDDRAVSIRQTIDGGYIFGGFSDSIDGDVIGNHGDKDYWIVKLSISGEIEWQKSFGGGQGDYLSSIQQTSDGGYIVSGSTDSNDGDVTSNHGLSDCWIVKLSGTSDLEWQKSFGGSDYDYGTSIKQTQDGGYIFISECKSVDGDVINNNGNFDFWIVKLNLQGTIDWQKSFGGSGSDSPIDIQQSHDGSLVVAGVSSSNDGDVSGNQGSSDFWITRLSAAGDLEWQKSLGGSDNDRAFSVKQTTDDGYIIAGSSESNNGHVSGNQGAIDMWIVKLNSAGILEWQKSLGGSNWERAYSIHQNLDGGFIVGGHSESNDGDVSGNHGSFDYWVVKLSPVLDLKNSEPVDDIFFYPNPAAGILQIEAISLREIILFNSLGQNCFRKVFSGESEATISVSHLMKGIYFAVILTEDQESIQTIMIN